MEDELNSSEYNINTLSLSNSPSHSRNHKANNEILLCPRCKFSPIFISSIELTNFPTITYECPNCMEKNNSDKGEHILLSEFLRELSDNQRNLFVNNRTCVRHSTQEAEAFCFDCNNAYCEDCLKAHEFIAPTHHFSNKTFTMIRNCPRHIHFSLNVVCVDCKTIICSQCQFEHEKKGHKSIFIEEYWDKLMCGLTYKSYQNFEQILEKRKIVFEKINEEYIKNIDKIIDKLKEVKDTFKNNMRNYYEPNVQNYKKLVEIIFNSFYFCNDLNCYNYEIINSVKTLNQSFLEDKIKDEELIKMKQLEVKKLSDIVENDFSIEKFIDLEKEKANLKNYSNNKQKLTVHKFSLSLNFQKKKVLPQLNLPIPKLKSPFNNCLQSNIETHKAFSKSPSKKIKLKQDVEENVINIEEEKSFDYNSFKKKQTLLFHKEIVSVCLLPDNLLAAAGGKWLHRENKKNQGDFSISIYSLILNKELYTLKGHSDNINSLLLLSNNLLASGSFDTDIIIWNYQEKQKVSVLRAHTQRIWRLAEFSKGILYSFANDKTMKLWDINTFSCVKSVTLTGSAYCVEKVYDTSLVIGLDKNYFIIYDIENFNLVDKKNMKYYAYSILGLSDHKFLIGNLRGIATLFDCNFNEIKKFKFHKDTVSGLIEVGNGDIISSSWDKTIKIWKREDPNKFIVNVQIIQAHTETIPSILKINAFSFISCSADKKAIIWDVEMKQND